MSEIADKQKVKKRPPWWGTRGRFLPELLAEFLASGHHYLATPIGDDGRAQNLLVYEGGRYVPVLSRVRSAIQDALEGEATPGRINSTVELLMELRKIEESEMDPSASDLINVRNGMLRWRTGELLPHGEAYRSTIRIPVAWDPDAESELLDRVVAELIPADTWPFFFEWVGYILTPSTKYQTAVIFDGGGGNGKSTILDTITGLLGEENVSRVSLQSLEANRFATAALHGKLANLFPDLDREALKSSSVFKSIVGGDPVPAERKFGAVYSFQPFARLMFSANEIPRTADKSWAFIRRLKIIPFNKRIEKPDPDMARKLRTPEVLSALLRRAVEGLRTLEERGGFEGSKSIDAAVDAYRARNDSAIEFIRERVVPSPDLHIPKDSLYSEYVRYCEEARYGMDSRQGFNQRLVEATGAREGKRPGENGKRVKSWVGIGWVQEVNL